MVRLNLLIADTDEQYLIRLTDYLQDQHAGKFSVGYVTQESTLKSHLETQRDQTDILLVAPGLAKGLYADPRTTVVLLSDGGLERLERSYPIVDKFQRGDQLAARLLQLYLEQHPDRSFLNTAEARCRMVAVYSPSGGCGKSTIAAGLSAMAHHRGSRALYLNLEGCESSEAWFAGGSSPSISELYYHLKSGAAQLSLKLEALSHRDAATRVRCFSPADSILDYNELTQGDLELLVSELRRVEDLDVVFVDLGSSVDNRNLQLLEMMDRILMVVADEPSSQVKVNRFLRQVPTLERKRNVDLFTRMVLVRNGKTGAGFGSLSAERMKDVCQLPKDPTLRQGKGISDRLSGPFGAALVELWHRIGMD